MNPICRMSHSAERGFTLVELSIVALLLMIMAGGILTAFMTGQASYVSTDAYIQVQQEARRAFDNVVRELRESGNISCGTGGVTSSCTNVRMNVQIALGFNLSRAGCPPNAVCWGNEAQPNQWVHYVITGAPNDQLVRCLTPGRDDAIVGYTGCRVLANKVKNSTSSFQWDSTNRIVTLNLEVEYRNAKLPGGAQTTGVLSSRVKLRNS